MRLLLRFLLILLRCLRRRLRSFLCRRLRLRLLLRLLRRCCRLLFLRRILLLGYLLRLVNVFHPFPVKTFSRLLVIDTGLSLLLHVTVNLRRLSFILLHTKPTLILSRLLIG